MTVTKPVILLCSADAEFMEELRSDSAFSKAYPIQYIQPAGDTLLEAVNRDDPLVVILDRVDASLQQVLVEFLLQRPHTNKALLLISQHLPVHSIEFPLCEYEIYPCTSYSLMLKVERLLRLRAEMQVAHERKLRSAQRDLFEMLMHDMGNVATVIAQAADYQRQVMPQDTDILALDDINDSAQFLLLLVNDALDVGRLENNLMPIQRRPTKIAPLLHDLTSTLYIAARDKNIRFNVFLADDNLPIIEIDARLIRRVLLNLLINAIKFSAMNSEIDIYVEVLPEKAMRISVRDEGPGIAPEYVKGLFDTARQVWRYKEHQQRAGYGLGLVFSRLAVESHHGRIHVQSELGHGSTFMIDLPLADE